MIHSGVSQWMHATECLSFSHNPYKAGNYNSAYTEALLTRLTKISSVGKKKKKSNIENGFKYSFAEWATWEGSNEL